MENKDFKNQQVIEDNYIYLTASVIYCLFVM